MIVVLSKYNSINSEFDLQKEQKQGIGLNLKKSKKFNFPSNAHLSSLHNHKPSLNLRNYSVPTSPHQHQLSQQPQNRLNISPSNKTWKCACSNLNNLKANTCSMCGCKHTK